MADNKRLFEIAERSRFYNRIKYLLNLRLVRFFKAHVFKGKSRLVVGELACGSGVGSHLIAQDRSVSLSVAMDINRGLFDQSGISRFDAHFLNGDLFHSPFASDTFDLVWNSSSIEHFKNPLSAVKEMKRVTKPQGYVFIGVPYLFGPLAAYFIVPSASMRKWLGRPYSFSEIQTLCSSCDLKITNRIIYFLGFFAGVLAKKNEMRNCPVG